MINKWEIYFCNLDPVIGSEQRGTRPVLIISTDAVNHNLPVSTVVPLSAVKPDDKIYPTEVILATNVTGLSKVSVAMMQQIRTVSHNRLVNLAGTVKDPAAQKAILNVCRDYFDL